MNAVVRESLCPDCANTGKRLHPSWARLIQAWHENHPAATEPSPDFVRAWFWTREHSEPVPRYIVCGCESRRLHAGRFEIDRAAIVGPYPYPAAVEQIPERLELDYWIGGELKTRRIPLHRLAAFLELAEQKFGLRLDEEGGTS